MPEYAPIVTYMPQYYDIGKGRAHLPANPAAYTPPAPQLSPMPFPTGVQLPGPKRNPPPGRRH